MAEKVSEWDREYMRRLGRYQDEANAEALSEHLELSGTERLARSERLSRRGRGYANEFREPSNPGALYDRARRLGLIKP
jgi:hypothetical protein